MDGFKAYQHYNGSALNLFRIIDHMKRFKLACTKLAFPSFKEEEL